MKYVNYNSVTVETSKRCEAALILISFLQGRYSSFYDNELHLNMMWLDPQYWQEGANNGKDKMLQLISYFEVPLAAADFDKTKDLKESHATDIMKIFLQNLFGKKCFNTRKSNSQIF